jgi:hypothetical protein
MLAESGTAPRDRQSCKRQILPFHRKPQSHQMQQSTKKTVNVVMD